MNRLITENLATWTTAPNVIKKLRELILELAVRGLLVQQDPNDEPSAVLLEKIAAEKARLVSEGKIKPSKPLPKISETEKPFVLPKGWEWTKLGEISQINPRNNVDDELEVSFIPMTLISTSHKGNHQQEKRQWSEIKTGFTHFAEGDIGIAKITPCFENSKAAVFSELFNGYGAGTTELHIVRPFKETLLPRYVLIYFKSPQFLLVGETKMTGTAGQKRLPREFVTNNPFPLPPLAEQHRIVTKVDELMQLCDQLEQKQSNSQQTHRQLVSTLLTTLTEAHDAEAFQAAWSRIAANFDALFTTSNSVEQLQQTILQLAVMGKLVPQNPDDEPASELLKKIAEEKARLIAEGKHKRQNPLPKINESEKPFVLPDGWEYVRFADVVEIIMGQSPPGESYNEVEDGIPLINGPVEFSNSAYGKTIKSKWTTEPTKMCKQDDLLICVRGSTTGRTNIAGFDACIGRGVAAIQPYIFSKYILFFLVSHRENFYKLGTGTTFPSVSQSEIVNMIFLLPPLAEQHRIVAKVDELMTLCEHLKTKLQSAQTLQQQLAQTLVQQAVA